ncbi:AbiH family protein [Bacteroides gallinaceum]|uniref:AbiH family protein n=2 Tax=Bacteroidaceae TaxID=815 RepID=A0ABT7X1F4_9BACE|nr:bacteriophage abortive infection AbiH family protein [Bacteroides gallinaceum]MDN0047864.1 AbiH family protein [Bacteroides gallinaceum]
MNIVYILGNGFDKAQGMATSYPEFYKYLDLEKRSTLIELLKKEIKSDKEQWSDMEEAFGKFSLKIDTEDNFTELYFDLNDLLQMYLKSEDEAFSPMEDLKSKFREDFLITGKYLEEADKIRFNAFTNSVNSNNKEFNVITFNYTNTLEKLLTIDTKGSHVEKSFGSNRVLHNIIHVHGSLGEAIIIGVDNETQIANEILKQRENVRDLFIKIESNHAMKNLRHNNCESFIKNAHLIILYGVSLGNTDLRWWTLIGQELKRRNNLAIIQHIYRPKAVLPTRKQLLARIERNHQKKLLQKMGIKQDEQSKGIAERLFFTVNSSIFKK